MKRSDFQFAVQLANTMQWNMTTEDFKFMKNLEPEGCFTLFYGSEPVGIATCISFDKAGWFGNLIVKDAYRGQGAGTLLVNHALNYLKRACVETVGLYAFPPLAGFYEQFGFKPDMDFLVLKGKTASPATAGTLQPRKATKQDFPAVIAFDAQCFGAQRKKLLEPLLSGEGNLCYIAISDHEITGYCAAKAYEETVEVGPLMCPKNRVETTIALLRSVLSKLPNRPVFACAPAEETILLETLIQMGLQEDFRVTRMFLGPAVAKGCTYMAESLERG
ncbi:MAG: GNAT family N-acetyltransferase [Candidatus Bathyarchaeota archaeon]|nr:GNAT family N-acetyltransferase [Candidatus Bathyarchaeota archaeon]